MGLLILIREETMEVKDGLISILTQYEGIVAALLGAVVGFSINEISKRIGKLRVYTKKYELQNLAYDGIGGYCIVDKIENAIFFKYEMYLQLYNSFSIHKVVRNIHLIIQCKDKTIIKVIPILEEEKERVFDYEIVNGKEFKEVKIYGWLDRENEKHFDSLKNINSIYITGEYPNGRKFKRKLV